MFLKGFNDIFKLVKTLNVLNILKEKALYNFKYMYKLH